MDFKWRRTLYYRLSTSLQVSPLSMISFKSGLVTHDRAGLLPMTKARTNPGKLLLRQSRFPKSLGRPIGAEDNSLT
jgi:hypothetical protein